MAIANLSISNQGLFWYRVRHWRSFWHYRRSVSIARKRAEQNPEKDIFCVSRMRGKLILHFYRSK